VITMSLGGIFSFTLQRALRRAVNADVTCCRGGQRTGWSCGPPGSTSASLSPVDIRDAKGAALQRRRGRHLRTGGERLARHRAERQ
jgi:hypothetical protein